VHIIFVAKGSRYFANVFWALLFTISCTVFTSKTACALLEQTVASRFRLCGFHQRCTEFKIFVSDSAPASAKYTPTPKHFKVLDPDSCLNSKVIYLKAVAIDTPVDLEI